ncbi:acyl transferase/acyl hydrolase/lysophospholipase [Flagelloscypha sp. PMI_526]|nr:acyl transferase/acyl hydrolase/lysophospholipase [Flagelloscypha sp. PMI_526]
MDGVDPIIALSLDGGGFLALSELYILKEILERLQYELNLKTVPLPCEVFDVIGGSGSGGIIALLLGRLRLDVDTAIRLFIQLYRSIYSGRLHTKGRRSKLFGAAFQILLTSVPGFGITDSLFETDPKCNTFVCASPTNVQNGKPTCFRNFVARKFRTFNCSIFEAARACTAHPQLFLPVKIGHPGALESFSDASAYGYSNPIQVVNEETESLFKDRKRVYLSLGSGVAHASPWGMGSRLVNTSGNGDVTTEDFMPHAPPGTFVRFSVEQGFHSHERHTFTDPGNILTQTTSYLKCAATEGHMPDIILPLVQRQISKLPPPDLRVKNSQDTLYHILSSGRC